MDRMNEFSQHRMRRLRREANPRTRLTTLQSPGAGKFWQIHSLLWAKWFCGNVFGDTVNESCCGAIGFWTRYWSSIEKTSASAYSKFESRCLFLPLRLSEFDGGGIKCVMKFGDDGKFCKVKKFTD